MRMVLMGHADASRVFSRGGPMRTLFCQIFLFSKRMLKKQAKNDELGLFLELMFLFFYENHACFFWKAAIVLPVALRSFSDLIIQSHHENNKVAPLSY